MSDAEAAFSAASGIAKRLVEDEIHRPLDLGIVWAADRIADLEYELSTYEGKVAVLVDDLFRVLEMADMSRGGSEYNLVRFGSNYEDAINRTEAMLKAAQEGEG